jgi:hypothetical protein
VWLSPLPTPGQTESPNEHLNVHIALDKKEFFSGDPMVLKLEVTNIGQEAILVPNFVSLFGGGDAYLEIELSNTHGPLFPHIGFAVDRVPAAWLKKKSPSEILLDSFLLLRPTTSFVQRIALLQYLSALEYEVKPGTYKLKAYYSSGGLFYPPAYQSLGLVDEDVKSLPFQAWHGKLSTNELSFSILPAAKKKGRS